MAKASLHSGNAAPAKQEQAAPVAKADGTGYKMPAVFSQTPTPIAARAWAPYITFAHPKRKDEWNKLTAKFGNVEEGDMYFINRESMTRLENVKLGLVAAVQYWVSKNAAGHVLASSMVEKPYPFKEHVQAIVLVYLDKIYPANCQFRTTKCPIAKALNDALIKCTTPEWGAESDAHKASLVMELPFLRFYGDCSLGEARPSKTSGLPYKPGQCVVRPVGTNEIALIRAFEADLGSPEDNETKSMMELVAAYHESKVKELTQSATG